MNKNPKVEVIAYGDGGDSTRYYERYENVIRIPDIDQGEKYRLCCQACPKFGRNLACPPHSPSFLRYTRRAKTTGVIGIRLPTEYFDQQTTEERYRSCYRAARSLLVSELLKYRHEGHTIAGSGACSACQTCVVEEGGRKCKSPRLRIYSLESLGVNVITLVKKCFGIDLDWSGNEYAADFVSAVGAVFL